MTPSAYETIRYEVDADDRVATITLDRPEVLNAFDRQMCEEIRDAWHVVKDDDTVHAVVLRAAGDRAFSAGLDTKQSFGQPDVVWNHDDPGEFLSPKWQKVWKPVVCAVHGMCTAGAFYFLNEADVVICSDDATFFDSHVTYGFVSAHRTDRADAAHRARRHAAHGADRQRRARVGRDRAAARARHRGGGPRRALAARARTGPAHRVVPDGGDAGHGARDLGVARQAVPRRDGAGPDVHAPRQPDRRRRGRSAPASDRTPTPRVR